MENLFTKTITTRLEEEYFFITFVFILQDESYSHIMCNNNWCLFLRLHNILSERLTKMYNQAVILANEETKDKKERKDSTAVALRLKPKSKTIIISHMSAEISAPKTFEPQRQMSPWTFEPQTKDKKERQDSTAVGLRLQPKSKAIIISHLSTKDILIPKYICAQSLKYN